MSRLELRAGASLAGVYGLRMLGLFFILPVFAIHAAQLRGGDNLTLVGLALGGLVWLLTVRFGAGVNLPRFVRMSYRGLVIGGIALAVFAAAGNALQRKR